MKIYPVNKNPQTREQKSCTNPGSRKENQEHAPLGFILPLDSSFYSTTQAIHIDMYMCTHIHTHARKPPTIHYEGPMKHTCKTYAHSPF